MKVYKSLATNSFGDCCQFLNELIKDYKILDYKIISGDCKYNHAFNMMVELEKKEAENEKVGL